MTVGIVTFARASICVETVGALLPLLGPDDELVVVEQAGSDVAEYCRVHWPGQVQCHSMARPSMVRARNVVIQRARGEVVLFVDDDVVPSAELVEAHWRAYTDPQVGGVAGRVLTPASDAAHAPPLPGTHWLQTDFEATSSSPVPHARGCNMSFRRSVLVAIGGFDTGFRPPFFFREDSDVSFRVRAVGYAIVFAPRAELLHLEAKTGGARVGLDEKRSAIAAEMRIYRSSFSHYRDNLYFLSKHFGGRELAASVVRAHRDYVGWSRWPWRLVAKNLCFVGALLAAAWTTRTSRPPYFDPSEAA